MERDYLKLCICMNSFEMYDKEHQALSRKEFRQFLLDMFDNKGPEHLIGLFKMYLKTHQLEDKWDVTAAG